MFTPFLWLQLYRRHTGHSDWIPRRVSATDSLTRFVQDISISLYAQHIPTTLTKIQTKRTIYRCHFLFSGPFPYLGWINDVSWISHAPVHHHCLCFHHFHTSLAVILILNITGFTVFFTLRLGCIFSLCWSSPWLFPSPWLFSLSLCVFLCILFWPHSEFVRFVYESTTAGWWNDGNTASPYQILITI